MYEKTGERQTDDHIWSAIKALTSPILDLNKKSPRRHTKTIYNTDMWSLLLYENTCVCIYIYIYKLISFSLYIYIYIYISLSLYIYISISIYLYLSLYIYIYIYLYTYIHIYTCSQPTVTVQTRGSLNPGIIAARRK